MTKEEIQSRLEKLEKEIFAESEIINNFIWESQEKSYDWLNKAEQISLISVKSRIDALHEALVSYNSWFINH